MEYISKSQNELFYIQPLFLIIASHKYDFIVKIVVFYDVECFLLYGTVSSLMYMLRYFNSSKDKRRKNINRDVHTRL